MRFREHGQVYFGKITVVTNVAKIEDRLPRAVADLKAFHWKIHDVSIMPVKMIKNS